MSTNSIDKRVVQMAFENDQFEKGIGTSMKSIGQLKQGLVFNDSTKNISVLTQAFGDLSNHGQKAFGNLTSGVSAMQIAVGVALGNIMTSAINAGSALVKSLTIEPISLGYADYGRKLTSIQTIRNATGKSNEEVNGYFDQLDEYADKTIYNLDHMTGAAAKFVNAGVDLGTAIPAIKGIANMVALAGQDANAAGIAFYNISQSIAGGFLTTMDYKSLNLANVATKEWKDNMIAGAVSAGTLTKRADGLYDVLGSKKPLNAAQLFTEGLSEQWASTGVLLDVLGQYGDTTTDIGKKAQAAAQDIKSWSMMMETLKASVGTGWTDTFEILIGNLDESKALFTPLTATIQGILDAMTNARNGLLQGWKDLNGRNALIDSFKAVFSGITDLLKPVSEAFKEIFPPLTAQKLYDITLAFRTLTEKFKMGEKPLAEIKRIFKGVFALVDIGRIFFLALVKGVGKFVETIKPAAGGFLELLASLGDWIVKVRASLRWTDFMSSFFEKLGTMLGTIVVSVSGFFSALINGFSSTEKSVKSDSLTNFLSELSEKFKAFGKVGEFFAKIFGIISKVAEKFGPVIKAIGSKIGEFINGVLDAMTRGLDKLDANKILDAFNKIFTGGLLISLTSFVNGIKKTVGTGMFAAILLSVKDFIDSGGSMFKGVAGILDSVRGSLDAYQKTLKSNALMKIAQAIGLLVLSIIALTLIDQGKLVNATAAISGMFLALTSTLEIFEKTTGSGKKVAIMTASLLGIAAALLLLSVSVLILSALDPAKAAQGVLAVGGVLGIVVAFQKLSTGTGGLAKTSLGILGLSVGLLGLSVALLALGSIDPETLGKGLITMGVALAMIAASMQVMGTAMTGAGALLIASAAILVLGMALKMIGSLSLEQVGVALLAIAGALVILGIAGAVLTPVAPTIAVVALSLLAIGAAALAVGLAVGAMGAGLASLAVGIVTLAGLSSAGIAALSLVIGGLAALIPMIAVQIVKGITAFLKEVYKSIPEIVLALVGISLALIKGFTEIVPDIVESILVFVDKLLTSLKEHLPEFVQSGYEMLIGVLTGIRDNIGQAAVLGYEIAVNYIKAVTEKIPDLIEAGFEFVIAFIDGLALAMEENMPIVMASVNNLSIAIIKGLIGGWNESRKTVWQGVQDIGQLIIDTFKDILGINSPSTVFIELAKNIVKGLANGLRDYIYLAAQAAVKLAETVLKEIKGVFDLNSPSKETLTIGEYVAQGLANGITKFGSRATEAAKEMGNNTLNAMSSVISRIADAVNSDMDVNPVLTPVIDLSNITKGGAQIEKMLSDKSLSVDTSLIKARSISGSIESVSGQTGSTPAASGSTSVVFNQTNNSPKELSRIDIYRQTKNQLLQLKGFGGAL